MSLAITSAPEAPAVGLLERLMQHADHQPNCPAIVCEEQALTYGELARRIATGAARLKALGCGQGDRIAILAPNTLDFIPAFFAAVACGGAAVTLPIMLPPDAIGVMLDDCAARAVVVAPEQADQISEALETAKASPAILGLHDGARGLFTGLEDGSVHGLDIAAGDLGREFNIVYSSGTTGQPKGILHSHRTRTAFASGMGGLGFDRECVCLISTPLYTNMSIPAFLATLWGGGCVSVMRKFDAEGLLRLAAEGATHFFLVPVQVQRIFDYPRFGDFDLSATRLKYVAGSTLAPELKRRLLDDWPGPFVEVYGMTEGAPVTFLAAADHPGKLRSVGRPPEGAQIAILNDEGRRMPTGEVGEVAGRTSSMMLGYNGRPQETRALEWFDERGERYFRSGDLGRLDEDGFLYIVDRKKDVIISGGYNIYSSDLEQVLLTHPAVAEAAVVGVKSARWGETPVAFVKLRPGGTEGAPAILDFANARLGRFQRLSDVRTVEDLPRNALGKVVKRELIAAWPDGAEADDV